MTRTIYTLHCVPNDGSMVYMVGDYYDENEAHFRAERYMAQKINGQKRFKSVTVIERTFTPGRQSMNACMLTIAR